MPDAYVEVGPKLLARVVRQECRHGQPGYLLVPVSTRSIESLWAPREQVKHADMSQWLYLRKTGLFRRVEHVRGI
jgi:hypothetical protein